MSIDDFSFLIHEIYPESKNASKVWIKWARELSNFDSENGRRAHGSYKTAEMYLEEYANQLRMIYTRYGETVASQIVSLAEVYSCPMPWEMEGAARFLAAGGDLDEIPEMEYAGTLEDYAQESAQVFA